MVRRPEQMSAWQAAAAEAVVADLAGKDALAGAKGVYLMNPSAYTAPDICSAAAKAQEIAAAERARVDQVLALSSVEVQHAEGTSNI